ncbi:hypothetical protein IQ273_31280, partial [Nodosilinea sp. LEGE 07298]|uniref:hypothetical protein n=1 Tax=Nodosilinea sp. LEGE 07298 TaxID=2777970 RepID=UPI00187E38FF
MGNYFRAPGAKVDYTKRETRNYVSRKARVSRGLNLMPTGRSRTAEGWRFFFASPRGPAADGGRWLVDLVRANSDGGG